MAARDEKNLAIAGYLTAFLLFVHFIIFVIVLGIIVLLNAGKGQQFASFHLRQMVGIGCIALLVTAFASVVPSALIALLITSGMVCIALAGLVSALKNQKDPLPVIGTYFQTYLGFIN